MLKTIRNAFRVPDLRKKLLFTLMIIVVFRIGSVIPVPFLDMEALKQAMSNLTSAESGSMFAYLDTLSGGAFFATMSIATLARYILVPIPTVAVMPVVFSTSRIIVIAIM